MKKIRIAVEAVVFAALTLLFLDFGGIFDKALGWLPKLQFWPAVLSLNIGLVVLLLTLTILFGRVYCSTLCPLGAIQDGIFRLKTCGKKSRKYRGGYKKPQNVIRYSILAAFIVVSALGFGAAAYLIEPYSIFGRMVTSTLGKSLPIAAISAGTLALIVLLVHFTGRGWWCNIICPVGSILSIFSRRAMLKPQIDNDKCVGCGLCAKACRSNCIDPVSHTIDSSRCVVCLDCLDNCHTGAIEFSKFVLRPQEANAGDKSESKAGDKSGSKSKAETGRRAFLSAGAFALASASLKAASDAAQGGLAVLEKKQIPARETPVVPAGAKSLKAFSQKCVGCQLCVSVCPGEVLSPRTGLDAFMQPSMNFDKGFCRPECTACSDVCPAGAIQKVTAEEKSAISIGHAEFIYENCVVTTDGVSCGNCARHCPAGAISMVELYDGLKIPSVNAERCIGCGRCEYVCPARPLSAIYVEGNKVHREV